jgi:hypothetical protein
MTTEDLKKSITFSEKSPFVQFNVPEKYQALFADFVEWINLYIGSMTKLDFLVEELEKIPQ